MSLPDFGALAPDLVFQAADQAASSCFALLDDSSASASHPTSRLYTGYAGELGCPNATHLSPWLNALQQALEAGWHVVLLMDYELGQADGPAASDRLEQVRTAPGRALLFARCQLLGATEVSAWLADKVDSISADATVEPAGIAQCHHSVSEHEFMEALARIHDYLRSGDTYQVNYTYRLQAEAYGSPLALYQRLRARQPVPYGALITLPEGAAVLSLSPELFIHHEHGRLTARPMKGTAAASADVRLNAAAAEALTSDPKTRAENLMIVDLLRNDLGRIAQPGSIAVPDLFTVEQHGQVLQVTSTVTARLQPEVSLAQVLAALYPCGSVTGAPKHRTMQIIAELETTPRGLYTGAIGWL